MRAASSARRTLERRLARRDLRRQARPQLQPPDPSLPIGHDTIPEISHVVVLMMENHSYDSYLGMLGITDGRGCGFTPDTAREPTDENPVDPEDPSQGSVRTWHPTWTKKPSPAGEPKLGVPNQSWHSTHQQFDGGRCDGFVSSASELGATGSDRDVQMAHWDERDLPFYYSLARTFPLADHWFSSCLGPTFPNRRFLIAGTANGLIDDIVAGMFDRPRAGTIFDRLSAEGISWANYHSADAKHKAAKRLTGRPGTTLARRSWLALSQLFPLLMKRALGELQFTADVYPMRAIMHINNVLPIGRFFSDAAAGKLPQVSIVDPDFGTYSEESPQDIQLGEGFAARVIEAVMHGPGWPRTLLIWTYDEHGGFFDHVPPPEAEPPDDVPARCLLRSPRPVEWLAKKWFSSDWEKLYLLDQGPSDYANYGFRVPAVIVSPYARKGFVTSKTYDHTSVLKLIETKWNLPPLTRRDAKAQAPLEALDLDSDPGFIVPPSLDRPAIPWRDA
jgi:phospholipase C